MSGSPTLGLLYTMAGRPAVFPVPEGTTTIGSARDNDLVLEHPTVKAHQVVLMREGDDLELRDLFAGETRVNQEPRTSGSLRPGDVLSLGEVRLRVMKVTGTGAHLRSSPPTEAAPAPRPAGPPAAPPRAAPPARSPEKEATGRFERLGEEPPPPDEAEVRLLREREARRAKSLARARKLSDDLLGETDFEHALERVAVALLDVFAADRAVTFLFEEDGRNPLFTVERSREGTDAGVGVADEIVDRCLQVRSVLRLAGGSQGLGGLAAPLLVEARAIGLLYFERTRGESALDLEDVHLMALIANQAALVLANLIR